MRTYEAYCKTLRAERREVCDKEMLAVGVIVKGIKAESEDAAAAAVRALNPELRVLAVREAQPEPVWPANLSNEALLNALVDGLIMGSLSVDDTIALREEIERRLSE